MTGQKVLVTGASGMLGRVLCGRLSAQNQVTGISRTGGEYADACDFSNPAQIRAYFEAKEPQLVINTAAYSDVDGCERDPKRAHAANALSVKYLSGLCGARGIPLVHVSTDYVFDGCKNSPYLENDATNPVNIYGLTKLEGEYHAARCASPAAIVRTSWLFGSGNPANFVNAIAARLKKESVVSVLDDQTDAPTGVADLSEALENIAFRLLSKKDKDSRIEIYHFCNTGSTTRLGMTVKMKEIMGLSDVRVLKAERQSVRGGMAAMRPRYAVMSNRHYEEVFGTRIRSWEESLKEYLLN